MRLMKCKASLKDGGYLFINFDEHYAWVDYYRSFLETDTIQQALSRYPYFPFKKRRNYCRAIYDMVAWCKKHPDKVIECNVEWEFGN
jgi:hypothetical protein